MADGRLIENRYVGISVKNARIVMKFGTPNQIVPSAYDKNDLTKIQRLKLGLCYFHHTCSPIPLVFAG